MPILPAGYNPYAAPTPYGRPLPPPVWQNAPQPRPAVPAAMAQGPRPKIRLQAPEPTRPSSSSRLSLPSPEQLGIATTKRVDIAAEQVDWNHLRSRMNQLGVQGFHLDRLTHGGMRVRFFLPAGQANTMHHIEAAADSEAQAVRLALDRAETWVRTRR